VSGKEGELLYKRLIAIAFMVMNEATGENCDMKQVTVAYCIGKIYIL
jgi:hypothetical protein